MEGILITDKNAIGTHLYFLRENANLTIKALSKCVDVSEGHLSEMESGKSLPSIKTLKKICEFYEISLSDFFKDEEYPLELTSEIWKLLSLTKNMKKEQIEHLNEFINMFYNETKK